MGLGDTIAFIVMVVGFLGGLSMLVEGYKSRMRVKERELELRLAELSKAASRSEGGEKFEERLRVLERIATDPKAKLANEIEALRIEREPVQ
jgi:hypothetical protein